jgi:dolichol-phosphate mannosyltransferase
MPSLEPAPARAPVDARPPLLAPPTYSVVAPVYNEQELIAEFCRRTAAALEPLGESFEIILVNDGSRDRSPDVLRELHEADPRVKVVNFSRNFGQQIAIAAGLDHARGEAVMVIDSDLQDPPEVLPRMIEAWRRGAEVVYGVRSERAGESRFKLATAWLFYRFIRKISRLDIPLDAGDFRLLDRRVVDILGRMREQQRFLRGLSVWVGFRRAAVEYKRHARAAGVTKYPLRAMIRTALDGVMAFSHLPLQLATYAGLALTGLSGLGLIAALILRLTGTAPDALSGAGVTSAVVVLACGVQLLFLGVLGEYLGRIHDEVKQRPLYIVASSYGFADAPAPRASAGAS